MQTTAQVIDTNNRPIGAQQIDIVTSCGNAVLRLILADGTKYYATGKSGTSNGHPGAAPAGTPMWELRTNDDARAWVDLAGTFVHLD